MEQAGCTHVVMEVSSQAMKLHRVAGIQFDTALFLNLSPDHISPTEHADYNEYRACKAALFAQCRKAVGNFDDPSWPAMRRRTRPGCAVSTFGFGEGADTRGGNIRPIRGSGLLGSEFTVDGHGGALPILPAGEIQRQRRSRRRGGQSGAGHPHAGRP